MRKIIIFFCLALVLACSVIPAFASSVGGTSNEVYSASAPIDYITFSNTKDILEWPGNYARRDGGSLVNPGRGFLLTSYANSVISTDFAAAGLNFTFYTDNLVVTDGYNLILENYFDEEPLTFTNVTVSGYVVDFEPNSTATTYVVKRTRFTDSVKVYSRSLDIGAIVREAIQWKMNTTSYHLPAFVQDLTITVDMNVEAGYSGDLLLTANSAIQNNETAMRTWMTTRYLPINHENASYFDATTWLKDSVGAFLGMEIAPGFSIDKIFWIILVIGVILWFCTLVI